MVHLQKLHEKYDMQGAAVLGVSLSPMEAVTKQVVGRLKLTYTMLKGADSPDVNKWDTRS